MFFTLQHITSLPGRTTAKTVYHTTTKPPPEESKYNSHSNLELKETHPQIRHWWWCWEIELDVEQDQQLLNVAGGWLDMARQLRWCRGEGVLWCLCDDEMTAQRDRESTIQFDSLQMMEERLGDWGKCQTVLMISKACLETVFLTELLLMSCREQGCQFKGVSEMSNES